MRTVIHQRQASTEPAFLRHVRLLAQRRLLWTRSLWARQPAAQGLAIPEDEVRRTLGGPDEARQAEVRFYTQDPESAHLTREIQSLEASGAADERWRKLLSDLQLSAPEANLLALALAVEMDPPWGRVCGYLHDDASACHATLWLAHCLFGWERPLRIGPEAGLVRWQLARPLDVAAGASSAMAPWVADPHLISWLLHGREQDDSLGATAILGELPPLRLCLYPDVLAEMEAMAVRFGKHAASALEIELTAAAGAGKQTLAAQFAAGFSMRLLSVDTERLLARQPGAMVRAVRMARLAGAALHWRDADRLDAKALQEVRGQLPLMTFGSNTRMQYLQHANVTRLSYVLPRLHHQARTRLWTEMTGESHSAVIENTSLLPGQMKAAALAAGAGEEAVRHVCRVLLHQVPGDLLTMLPLSYTWDDIVLAKPARENLEEIEMHIRLRTAVLEDWGFERLTPLGRGLSALFAGPSGTGKTMAAQIIGRSLGLEVRRVDLSGVVNKYIGETEKRLKQVFDACENDTAILFFDEADALFGQRTQVKDAHDRFANIEINYLLQRMETFNGVAILATNRKEELDRAFLRRLRFIVDFLSPGPAERRILWRKALPRETPEGLPLLDENIDWEALATNLDLNGAAIKSSALRAAFLARAEGSRIGMRHLLTAVRKEMQKQGKVLRSAQLEDMS